MSSKKYRAPAQQHAVQQSAIEISASRHSGPLPSAQQLQQYEHVCPGAADRIIAMAERNAVHRQELEKTVVHGNVAAQKLGQIFAFILALVVMGAGAWLVHEGKTTLGLWIMLGDVTALAAVFLGARWMQKREREQRRRELEGP